MSRISATKGFIAAALAIIGTVVLYLNHDDGFDDLSSFQQRELSSRTGLLSYVTDPKVTTLKEASLPKDAAKELDLAVCVVGAVRTFPDHNVIRSFNHQRFPENTHFFHYLFAGTELSARGQADGIGPDQAPGMAHALARSTAFRFQYQENDFTCDNQSNGKFFKISQCAKMVDEYSRVNNVTFKAIAFIRPDLIWECSEFPPYHTIEHEDWYTKSYDEVFAISGSEAGRRAAMDADKAQCCNSKSRRPAGCFLEGYKESRTNFIQHQHFISNLKNIGTHFITSKGGCGVRLKRMAGAAAHGAVWHAKFRPEVVRCKVPQTSPVVSDFQSLSFDEQKNLLEELLSVPASSQCME